METYAEPIWPVIVLAGIQLVDAILCIRPVAFVRQCLDDVHCPKPVRRLLTPIKLAACAGLLTGIYVPFLGLVTCVGLVCYFLIAVTMHVLARDFGLNAFNATGLALLCAGVSLCFL